MARKLIFATGNEGKMREIRAIMEGSGYEILSMKEAGVYADVTEDGTTFEENALIKARAIHQKAPDALVLADDSGLVIDYLNGEPGIYSARYMGEDTPYSIKNTELLRRMEGAREWERTARFVCAIAAVNARGEEQVVRGVIEGRIGHEIAGRNGFGYDPIFYVPEYGMSTAEMSEEMKNTLSHRGRALRKMKELLDKEENETCAH